VNAEQVIETIDALYGSLADVQGVRVDRAGTGHANPPAFSLGPPTFVWDGYGEDPTEVSFDGMLYVPSDDRAIGRLMTFLPIVRAALETVEDVVITGATPELFRAGGADLPAYRIHVEVT
jgi:hypothetical protein